MGGGKIAPWLREYSSRVPKSQAIVEVGCWLGACTQCLVRPEGKLFVYDRFRATEPEVYKAQAFGVTLTVGQDTLPLVNSIPATFIKGELMEATYDGPTIGMYVDDASKRPDVWGHSMSIFEPHFTQGTVLFLMDYDYPICEIQRVYAKRWTMLERRIGGTSCAIFRC